MSNLDRMAVLRDYIKEEPENPFNYYALALEISNLDPTEASELYDYVLENHPDYLPVYFSSALFFFELDQISKAKTLFEKGIKLAESQNEGKALKELTNAYQNFLFETDQD
jgi:tetratricopeptide (TPR) repeat protein